MRRLLLLALLGCPLVALPAGTPSTVPVSEQDATRALKDALALSAGEAIARLGQENGFLLNDRVRIPLPDKLAGVESTIRRFGMGRHADELVIAMNRAAESAVPEARALLLEAVNKMTIADAKKVLTAGDDAATRYFRVQTEAALTARLLPLVQRANKSVRVADSYNRIAGRAVRYGLLRNEDGDLDRYVTRKTLDGLYLVIAQEERAIRANPLRQTQALLRKVFGTLLQ